MKMLKISTISNSNKNIIIKLEGKITDSWVDVLEDECANLIHKTDSKLVLDITDVSYISGDGISLLIKIKNKIKLVNPQPYLQLCLKKKGLGDLLK